MPFLLRLFLNALGLALAATLIADIRFDGPWSVFFAALVAGLVNALIRPILFLLTLPLTILTLGLFTLILNALMFQFVGWLVGGFHVDSFTGAFLGALLLSIVSFIGSRFLGGSRAPR
jgi:putative membrane protein